MKERKLCPHIQPGQWPFRPLLTIDEHLGFTDALVECRECGAIYLLEMLDWLGQERVMRISVIPRERAQGVIRDLSRGSCDLSRAGHEVHHMQTSNPLSPWLLLVDWRGPQISALVAAPTNAQLPGASWRDLPCDGEWVRYARSKTEIVKP